MKLDVNKINSMNFPDRFDYLRKNKHDFIETKKYGEMISDICYSNPVQIKTIADKSKQSDENVIHVKVVANTANFIDSQMDLLTGTSWDKSINERKGQIPHLYDHERSVMAKIGKVTDIYGQDLSYSELGIKGQGFTRALIFETDVRKDYNEKIFNLYKNNEITQHSIGLKYIKLDLAINDINDKDNFPVWNDNFGKAINQDLAIKNGYFWVVKEIMLIENSAVLFGANEITPTLEVSEPGKSDASIISEPAKKSLNYSYLIKNIKN